MSPNEPQQDAAAAFDAAVAERRLQEREPELPEADADPGPDPADTESQQEPAPEAGSSVSGVSTPAPADEPIALDALPPAVRARVERAQQLEAELHQERSDKIAALNRLQPTQRRLSDLERQLANASKTPAAPAPVPAPAADSLFDSPEWKRYEADFPSEAAIQRKAHEAALSRISDAETKLTQRMQQAEQKFGQVDAFAKEQATSHEMAALNHAHPDWQELVFPASQEHAVQVGDKVLDRTFVEWLTVQNPAIQGLFGSDYAQDNIDLMWAYKRDLALAERHAGTPTVTPEAEAAQRAHQRRDQARAASVSPDLRGQPAAARVDISQMSEADQFDYLARQRRRQARA